MSDGVVSSGSPADRAHVPRNDAQVYSHSKTYGNVLLRSGRLALIHTLKRFQFVAKTATCITVVPPILQNVRLTHLPVVSVVSR